MRVDAFIQQDKKPHGCKGDLDGAIAECNHGKGSIANVVSSGLTMYREMESG